MARTTDFSTEELLEMMLVHMQRMDKRDKWRAIGGFIRSIINLIPIALLVLTTWYAYAHQDELLKKITENMSQSMAKVIPGASPEEVQRMMNALKK